MEGNSLEEERSFYSKTYPVYWERLIRLDDRTMAKAQVTMSTKRLWGVSRKSWVWQCPIQHHCSEVRPTDYWLGSCLCSEFIIDWMMPDFGYLKKIGMLHTSDAGIWWGNWRCLRAEPSRSKGLRGKPSHPEIVKCWGKSTFILGNRTSDFSIF